MRDNFIKYHYPLIEKLVSMKQKNLLCNLNAVLNKYYEEENVELNEKFLIAKGDIPIALVAHLDTVHITQTKSLYHDQEKKVLWSPQGIGADDRAGVFAILDILRKGYRPSVIFCCDEEVGGIGASKLVLKYPKPFTDIKYLIELDRSGYDDAVFYRCNNTAFKDMILDHGFQLEWGSFSDISIIAPKWDVAAVNLSIGYYNEHSLGEIWNYAQTFETIDKVIKILEQPEIKSYDFIPEPSMWEQWKLTKENKTYCVLCGEECSLEFIVKIKETDNEGSYFINICLDCATEYCIPCEKCNEFYLDEKYHICSAEGKCND